MNQTYSDTNECVKIYDHIRGWNLDIRIYDVEFIKEKLLNISLLRYKTCQFQTIDIPIENVLEIWLIEKFVS